MIKRMMVSVPISQNWVEENLYKEGKSEKSSLRTASIQDEENLRSVSILNLPSEVIIYIFSFLSKFTLTNRVNLVCKAWKTLSEDPSLWKSLSLKGKSVDNLEYIPKTINKYSRLKHLSIEGGTIYSCFFEALTTLSETLQFLSLYFSKVDPDCVSSFEVFMKSAKKLKCLSLDGCDISSDNLEAIHHCKQLSHLNLSHCVHLSNYALTAILESCKLEHLNIDGINFLDGFAISSIFEECSDTIVSVSLDGENLSDDVFTDIACCPQISQLSLSFSESITDKTLERISQLTFLQSLQLRKGHCLSAHGIKNMFQHGFGSHLTHLNLAECSLLTNASLVAVADNCPNLISLNVSWCWELTDESVSYLISKCLAMEDLNFTGLVCINGLFISDLQNGCLEKLKVINLEQCGYIDDDELEKLVELRPSIQIFAFWGDLICNQNS